jgi:hypothetical protein
MPVFETGSPMINHDRDGFKQFGETVGFREVL